jgi:hypothetical protein
MVGLVLSVFHEKFLNNVSLILMKEQAGKKRITIYIHRHIGIPTGC